MDLASSGSSILGLNDQACNECKRRKGRCDRQLPECGPCAKNKRHCLYDKHSRTPLTRKYLTSVEERLRQMDLRARQMERRAQVAEARLAQQGESTATARRTPEAQSIVQSMDKTASGARSPNTAERSEKEFSASAEVIDTAGHRTFTDLPNNDWLYHSDFSELDGGGIVSPTLNGEERGGPVSHELEVPPPEAEDFSWDEQSPLIRPKFRQGAADDTADGEPSITDGMASLSVEDGGSGYLGVASGAAMLRLLLPDAEHRRPLKHARQTQVNAGIATDDPSHDHGWVPTPIWHDRNIAVIDLDGAINSYFSLYHQSYPIVHEPSFRAQYAQVLPRPNGRSWNGLAYMIGAIGMFTAATEPVTQDLDLFEAAKANISIDSLETGNLTLVQYLVLVSNYLQKRNKPNSGYNYLGLALNMAMGLGLHKEFHNWQIAPLAMEIRRRVWWCLAIFAVGAMITFGRPLSWPGHGVEVSLPLNVDDRDLNNVSTTLPQPKTGVTTYSAVSVQARFHLATNDIYSMVISINFPSAAELIRLDDERVETWRLAWHADQQDVPPRFRLSRSIMEWRYRNFRIIMYRPFVIRHVLQHRQATLAKPMDWATNTAIQRCLHEAESSINTISAYWFVEQRNCMASWYALYFLFQASLIPVMCLRNDPTSEQAQGWRQQISTVLSVLDSMHDINPASRECRRMITKLSAGFITMTAGNTTAAPYDHFTVLPVEESPQTQLSSVYPMMWPDASAGEVDILMDDTSWTSLLNEMPDVSKPRSLRQDQSGHDSLWN